MSNRKERHGSSKCLVHPHIMEDGTDPHCSVLQYFGEQCVKCSVPTLPWPLSFADTKFLPIHLSLPTSLTDCQDTLSPRTVGSRVTDPDTSGPQFSFPTSLGTSSLLYFVVTLSHLSNPFRPKAMTVEWSSYAQSISKKNPMKGEPCDSKDDFLSDLAAIYRNVDRSYHHVVLVFPEGRRVPRK